VTLEAACSAISRVLCKYDRILISCTLSCSCWYAMWLLTRLDFLFCRFTRSRRVVSRGARPKALKFHPATVTTPASVDRWSVNNLTYFRRMILMHSGTVANADNALNDRARREAFNLFNSDLVANHSLPCLTQRSQLEVPRMILWKKRPFQQVLGSIV
jgi:hypothetical protein